MNATVRAVDLKVGDVITDDGRVEVLSAPEVRSDGRAYFQGRDLANGKVTEHRVQAGWDMKILRGGT